MLAAYRPEIVRSSGGIVHVWRPMRGVFATHIEGVMKLDMALAVETNMRRVAAEGRFYAFHDWAEMTDYETESRVRLTRAVIDVRSSVDEAHLLVASRFVALGVQAANLVVKILEVHTSRPKFLDVMRDRMNRRRAAS
jgi:hypothetical protein